MSYKQLELFQPAGNHEFSIFELAKKAKKVAQSKYLNFNIEVPGINKIMQEQYGILQIKLSLDFIGDKDALPEPSTPKVYIWQFTPSITLSYNGETEAVKESGSEGFFGPKIIPKWMHSFLTTHHISKNEFIKITSQYFMLELLTSILGDPGFVKNIENKIAGRSLIISFNSNFFAAPDGSDYGLYDRDMFNKVLNYYTKLKNIQKENWYYVGTYIDFADKADLLADIDKCPLIKNEISPPSDKDPSLFQDLFQNDYLLLNNNDFFQQVYNTHGWDTDIILSPLLATGDFTDLSEELLPKKKPDDDENALKIDNEKRKIYCYIKKQNSKYIRSEILFPTASVEKEKLKQIVSITRDKADI